MAELIVHNPPRAVLKASGYIGSPEGDIELTENDKTYNVTSFASATVKIPEEEKTVTPSAVKQEITPDNGLLSKVTVLPASLEERTVTPTIVQQTITPEAPAIGLSKVTVGAALPPPILVSKQITENGTYTAEEDNADGYSDVTVAVPREITKLVDGTITEYIDDEVTAIAPYAFYGKTALTTCIAPNVRTIGNNSFQNTNALETVDFSNVETIGNYAFYGSSLLNGGIIRFPNCTTVNERAFMNMVYSDSLPRKAIFPKLLNLVSGSAFAGSTAHRTIHCLVFKQKVTLGEYNVEFFYIRSGSDNRVNKIYVPQRYFDWYTTATNWSAGYSAYPNSIWIIEDHVDYLVSLGFSREELLREDEVPT